MRMEETQLYIEQLMSEKKSCAFTGHRILGDDFPLQKLKRVLKKLVDDGVLTYYNGMAMGFDLLAAEEVLKRKKKNTNVRLIACIPCYGQEKKYSKEDKKRYVNILKGADEIIYVSEEYYKGCMQKRDRFMADNADTLITFCKKEKGGTAYTVAYFQKKYKEKEIIFL